MVSTFRNCRFLIVVIKGMSVGAFDENQINFLGGIFFFQAQ